MLRGFQGLLLTVALAALLTVPASAQEGATLPSGPISFSEPLEVGPRDTLTIGPGTRIYGSAYINVSGTLVVKGAPGSLAEFNIPVRVQPGGRAFLEHARFSAVNATALDVLGGETTLANVEIGNNTWGVRVNGTGVLRAADVTLANHSGEALTVSESAIVLLARTTLVDNARGATMYSARVFHVNDSVFARNVQHLVVDLGPWSVPREEIVLARDRFSEPAATPAQLPSIVLRHDPPLVDAGDARLVRMMSNHVEGAAVGVRIEGRALVVESTNDTFVDNAIGVSVQQSTVRLVRPTFGNDRDVDGSGRITLDDPTYSRAASLPLPTAVSRASWLPWAIGAGVVVILLAGALIVPRLVRPRALPPAPAPASAPAPVAVPVSAPEPDAAAATQLTPLERRILEDVVAHPGTAQRAIADRLGYTRQALHYHVKKLEARGLIRKAIEGRETRCEVPPQVASLLLATRTGTQEKG